MTSGISVSADRSALESFLPIVVERGSGNIYGFQKFTWAVNEDNFLAWTVKILEIFQSIEDAVIDKADDGQPLEECLSFETETFKKYLEELAKWGTLAYRNFFDDETRRRLPEFFHLLPGVPNPTFFSS